MKAVMTMILMNLGDNDDEKIKSLWPRSVECRLTFSHNVNFVKFHKNNDVQ